jgi:hypothetical protein
MGFLLYSGFVLDLNFSSTPLGPMRNGPHKTSRPLEPIEQRSQCGWRSTGYFAVIFIYAHQNLNFANSAQNSNSVKNIQTGYYTAGSNKN